MNLMQFVILVKRTVNLKTFWTPKMKEKARNYDVNRHSFYPMRIIGNDHQGPKDKSIKLAVEYQTTKICFFTSTKDRTPLLSNSCVVYKMTCPSCAETYVGKTECTLHKRTTEHACESKDSAINQHLNNCADYHHRGLHAMKHYISKNFT